MNSNYRANQIAIKQFRKELKSMLGDISEIDKHVLTIAVNRGLADVKRNTPTDTGFMRKNWRSPRAVKIAGGLEKGLLNSADYGSFVNNGHRIVNGAGETVGFVTGLFMLEKAAHKVRKFMKEEFKKEMERVKREHDS